jgi:hypothetical protein
VSNPGDLTFWLAVIAIAAALQVVLLIGTAVFAWRMYARTAGALQTFHDVQLTPLVTRINLVLDDAHDVMGRMKDADAGMRRLVSGTGARAARAATSVGTRVWPLVSLGRRVWTAVAAFSRR